MSRNKRIFITGSCSAGIGNWEQQLGNAAILIGLLNSIHKNLPGTVITTKYQLSEEFLHTHCIQSLNFANFRLREIERKLKNEELL